MKLRYALILSCILAILIPTARADEVSDWIRRLDDEDIFARREAIQALGELADGRAVDPLLEALKDKDRIIRYSACQALGMIGGQRVIEELTKLANSTNPDIRQMAVIALGMADDDRAFELLLAQLKDQNLQTRWAGVVALGMLGDPRALPYLEKLKAKDTYYIQSAGRYPIREAASSAIASISSSINWTRSLERGLEVAKNSGKPLLVYFYIWWDKWSKLMDGLTFADRGVVELAKDFVCIKVNAFGDKSISERYAIRVSPTVLILSPDLKEIARCSGFTSKQTLVEWLKLAQDQVVKRNEAVSWWSEANNLMDRGKIKEAIPLLEKILARGPRSSPGSIYEDAKFVLAYSYAKTRRYQQAIDEFTELLDKYPDYGKSDKALYCLGLSYLYSGRYDEAVRTLEAVVNKFPNSEAAESANRLLTKLKKAKSKAESRRRR